MSDKVINQMPVKTWNWLKMNEVHIDIPDDMCDVAPIVIHGDEEDGLREMPFVFKNGSSTGGKVDISVDEGKNQIILMDFKAENGDSGDGFAAVDVDITLEKSSELTLVQVHRLSDKFVMTNTIRADIGEKADFHLIQVFLRGAKTYADVEAKLPKRKSALHIDTGYLTTDDRLLDINYNALHSGAKSTSDIDVSGVMCDRSKKNFRGTIDFRLGADQAKGNEIENVLVMDPDVVNKTIPIILCEEEDVEGNHGATIGRLNDDMVYYMRSRGLDDATIREMMKVAPIDAVLRRIPDRAGEFRDRIRIEEGLTDEQ